MIDAAGLRVMRAIAEEGSFTAAALALGYSQPAVSQMVKRLEQRTGTVLVEKVGRSVRLTEAGNVLARHAAPVLAALDAAEEEVAAIAGLRSGRVRLMAFPSSSVTLVPRALAAVRRQYPDLSVQFAEAEPPESIAALRSGEVDLAVAFSYDGSDIARGEDLEGFAVHPLLEEEVRVALPRDHGLAEQDVVSMTDLTDEDWIAGCPRCRGHLLQIANNAGFAPKVAFETEDYVAVQGFVAAGLGVALIPDLIRDATSNPDVAIRPLDPTSYRRIHAVTTEDLLKVPAVAATLEALLASAGAVAH
ncbi:LysR family transcriptional regulator [Janibacter cremeus]|uniref:DNA-binding transcriptional LysR family regulator n=1 Tax=Janibacter cremeus TaxID=1285192 RepID=A0A852VLV1_9MICO|nr:LysR family transcriptional regulator [Janibacter cremeus]NYF97076.1 DNA-binding transcriptional LysR family regulator [Janibacter cremeus]